MNSAADNEILSHEALIGQLSKASAYPHSVNGPVVVHETHISWVFLAGHFAYKIKKPITTDFLDYGTLEKRHHACCEELRLDSRYADGLYLEVVPITLEDGQVRMDGDAQPIEFAIRMRRFPEASLLSERIDADQVKVDDIVQLAKTIANFHRRATVDRETNENTLVEIRDQAMANFKYLREEASLDEEGTLGRIEEWTEQSFVRHHGLFHRRMREGFIRECHGDLHCDNIVFWRDQFFPFDGIEFNPKYSWIDVLSDVGFLVMDLQARNRRDLSAIFLNAYLEETGDYEALGLLRWYMVYRALVRAKVAVMHAQQTTLDVRQRSFQFATARTFLNLAFQITQPVPRHLWITHGVSGSGKTTGSQRFVESDAAIRLRSDVERKRLFGSMIVGQQPFGAGQGMYSTSASETTYQVLLMRTRMILTAGFSVVVDATFLRHVDRQRFQALATAEKVPFRILDFHADEATLRRRIADRSLARNDASDADLSVLQRQLIEQEPLTDAESVLTTESTTASCLPIESSRDPK